MEYQEMVFQGIGSLPELQESGRQGWELVDLKGTGYSGGTSYRAYTAVLRRNPDSNATWEYQVFNTADIPRSWHDHIGSCGWESVGSCIYMYVNISLYVFKRSGKWAGSDDGDIVQRLRDFGRRTLAPFIGKACQSVRLCQVILPRVRMDGGP
jgi:hypothetical protein